MAPCLASQDHDICSIQARLSNSLARTVQLVMTSSHQRGAQGKIGHIICRLQMRFAFCMLAYPLAHVMTSEQPDTFGS